MPKRYFKIDWWGWWALIQGNNPSCHYHYLELMKNNPPGDTPCFNRDLPF